MEQKRSFLNQLFRLLVLAVLAAEYLAVCSLSTTPLLRFYAGQDSAFFRLVGEGMTKGMLPYRDYFDMKGPYLFLMEYVGQLLLPGRLGAFAVQCVCLFVTLLFAHKCFDLAFPEKGCPLWAELLLLLPGAVMLSYTMTGGNLTEELSLPFLMPCLYLCLKYLGVTRIPSPENQEHPPLYGFYYGIAFGIMAMVRVTNAAIIGAILLTVTCNLLAWKRFRNLFANAGMFLLGVLVGVAPACVWAACNGILGDMIAQVFVFGFAYSDEVGFVRKLWNLKEIWPCLLTVLFPLIVLLVYRVKDWKLWLLYVSGVVTLLVAAAMGNCYAHYFVLALPLWVLGGYLLAWNARRLHTRRAKSRWVCVGLSAALLLASLAGQWKLLYPRAIAEIRYAMYCALTHTEEQQDYNAVQSLLARVPEEERDGVYVYGLASCSAWYVQAGLQPPMRYCDWQPHYIQLDPEIGSQIGAFLKGAACRWVVTPSDMVEPEGIASVLGEEYKLVDTQGSYSLWEKDNTNAQFE